MTTSLPPPPPPARHWAFSPRFMLLAAACIAIAWVDGMVGGIVVGVVLMVPVVLSSLGDSDAESAAVFLIAVTGFSLAILFGHPPTAAPEVYIPNRALAIGAMAIGLVLSVVLRHLRRELAAQHEQALASSDLNRLLISLVAHDLRSPLALAGQTFEYVAGSLDSGETPDVQTLRDVRARLQRSLDNCERLVALAQLELSRAGRSEKPQPVRLGAELQRHIASFRAEAEGVGKQIRSDVVVPDRLYLVDVVVLMNLLDVLIDNALVHARPGVVDVSAAVEHGVLRCVIVDPGPADEPGHTVGLGQGLRLAQRVARRARGSIEQALPGGGDDRSRHVLRLPAVLAEGQAVTN